MKENNKMSLINLIDYLSEKVTNFLKKAGRLAANKNKKDSVLIATKIVVTIIVLAVLSIPFSLVKEPSVFSLKQTKFPSFKICTGISNVNFLSIALWKAGRVFGTSSFASKTPYLEIGASSNHVFCIMFK